VRDEVELTSMIRKRGGGDGDVRSGRGLFGNQVVCEEEEEEEDDDDEEEDDHVKRGRYGLLGMIMDEDEGEEGMFIILQNIYRGGMWCFVRRRR